METTAPLILRQPVDRDPVPLGEPDATRLPAMLCTAGWIDPGDMPPDPSLLHQLGTISCLEMRVLPWRRQSGVVVVLSVSQELPVESRDRLETLFGPIVLGRCRLSELADALREVAGPMLAARAETRVPLADSCRQGHRYRGWPVAASLCVAACLLPLLPVLLLGWAALTLALCTALKAAAAVAAFRRPPPVPLLSQIAPIQQPVVSLLVPLYREAAVVRPLMSRLNRLDYPRDRLDLCLIVEDDDMATREALEAISLPPWTQVIIVPEGRLRTKPRALNYALDYARGTIIGIYDAEDLPAPDQISRVVARFAQSGPRVACLQGMLDHYNAHSNWLARCFTLEYAAWFRVILPGMQRLGLAVPLGGTTLFLRRHAIESVGGWDAHNVTEDADLGIRLARRGYLTELIDTVTEEEANARAWPWVKQRSRWLKGYALTWAVAIRDPALLWRELGAWRFFGVQVLFLGTLSQFALAPLLWSFWLLPLGLPHPLAALLPHSVLVGLAILFLVSETVNLTVAVLAARRAGKPWLALWAPTLQLYFPLATLAVWRALWQAVRRPFFWEKTTHGVFQPAAIPPPRPSPHPASVS